MHKTARTAKAVMDNFHDGLSSYDYTCIMSCWNFPAEVVMSNQKLVIQSPRELRSALRGVHGFYATEGVAKVIGETDLVHQTSDEEALCLSKFRAFDAQGALLAQWNTSYLLLNCPQGWRITKANISEQIATWKFSESAAIDNYATALSSSLS